MKYIGINPGFPGGIALLDDNGKIRDVRAITKDNYKMSKGTFLTLLLAPYLIEKHPYLFDFKALIEKPMVGAGESMENFSKRVRDAGIWEGWCQSYVMRVYSKTTHEWQKPFRTMQSWLTISDYNLTYHEAYRSFATVKEIFGKDAAYENCIDGNNEISKGVCDAILMAKYLQIEKVINAKYT